MKLSLAHQELIEQLRANNTVTRERLAAFENDPIALADFMAKQSNDFIRKLQSNELVYKDNSEALVSAAAAAASSPFDDPAFFEDIAYVVAELRKEFTSGDRILKQRVQELEKNVKDLSKVGQKVKDLSEQLSVFNRVAASCDAALQTALLWLTKQSSSK